MISRRHFLGSVSAGVTIPAFFGGKAFNQMIIKQEITLSDEALRIHHKALVVDTHNDLFWQMRKKGHSSFDSINLRENHPEIQTDIPRLLKGGIGAQFWAAEGSYADDNTMSSTGYCMEDINLIFKMAEEYPDIFEMAFSADDILRIHKKGKIASLIGIEGGYPVKRSLNVLESFYRLGARYMTLCHSTTNDLVDSATDKAVHEGLSDMGRKLVGKMNQLGMMVDISHVSANSMRDVIKISQAPVIASHSSAFALSSSSRNVPDDILAMMAKNEGIVMVNFFAGFLTHEGAKIDKGYWEYLHLLEKDNSINGADRDKLMDKWDEAHPVPGCSVEIVGEHIDHIVKIAGIDHVGLGSDFDGIPLRPKYLEDVSCFPYITQVLLDRGYNEEDILKVLGGNFIRTFKKVEEVAKNSAV